MLTILIALLIVSSFFGLIIFGLYMKFSSPTCKSKRNLNGKVVIVTGGTAGMGIEIAVDLAMRGAKVIIACPVIKEGENAKKRIIEKTKNPNVIFKLLNLASFESVRNFAAGILETEERLDILINNAGVGCPGDFQTTDKLHFVMQVNYYGHFLLTLLLLPLLKKSGTLLEPSRVVLVSSDMHLIASSNFGKYNETDYWWLPRIYANSKLYLILFAHELGKRMKSPYVVINSVHPGTTGTAIFDTYSKLLGRILKGLTTTFLRTPREGAQTTLHVALDEEVGKQSGLYYKDCKVRGTRRLAKDDSIASQVWEESVSLVKLDATELEICLGG